jgi:hypothetical protein
MTRSPDDEPGGIDSLGDLYDAIPEAEEIDCLDDLDRDRAAKALLDIAPEPDEEPARNDLNTRQIRGLLEHVLGGKEVPEQPEGEE